MNAQKIMDVAGVAVFGRIVRCAGDSVVVEVIVIPQGKIFSSHIVEVDRHNSQCVRDAVINAIHQNPSIMGW